MREFGEWSAENGVKGKYSIVPYPACTGWVNRFIPGWTKRELEDSLDLVREIIVPNWDIHPEMISHTRVIDIKTGRPFPQATPDFMENWEWSQNKSADELAAYQAYALNILKEAGLYCEGLTTPGGYAGRNQDNLALGTLDAVRDVYGAEIPHYFRDLFTEKGKSIESGEPAIMVCHWPGIYYNGEKVGFNILKEVKHRLDQKYNHLIWMKLSEISRYWAAKELTTITVDKNSVKLKAPFASPDFTLKINTVVKNPVVKNSSPLQRMNSSNDLKSGTYYVEKDETLICFDLKKGETEIMFF